MRRLRRQFFSLSLVATTGCSLLHGQPEAEPQAVAKAQEHTASQQRAAKLKDEQELKLAKLWARVDELEEEQVRAKERLALVEKGLTLGLMPEELRKPSAAKSGAVKPAALAPAKHAKKTAGHAAHPAPAKVRGEDAASDDAADGGGDSPRTADDAPGDGADAHEGALAADDEPKAGPETAVLGLSPEDADAYQKALATAHDQFRAGRYGRAIVEYSALGKRFGDQANGGMHLYWTAKCWVSLKEYNTARQQLTEFLQNHAASPWVPRAQFELGRVEWQLGMQETALGRFREIIRQHPYEDAAEMAKMELQNLDKKL